MIINRVYVNHCPILRCFWLCVFVDGYSVLMTFNDIFSRSYTNKSYICTNNSRNGLKLV